MSNIIDLLKNKKWDELLKINKFDCFIDEVIKNCINKKDSDCIQNAINQIFTDYLFGKTNRDCVIFALKVGITNINQVNNNNESIAILATKLNDIELISLINNYPMFDIDVKDNSGKTALFYAVENKNVNLIKKIKNMDPDLDIIYPKDINKKATIKDYISYESEDFKNAVLGLRCYLENEPEYKQKYNEITLKNDNKKFLNRNIFDATNIATVKNKQNELYFYCTNNSFYSRNILDFFDIIIDCINGIKTLYESETDESPELSVITFKKACDPLTRFIFNKEQIQYIRSKRRRILCQTDIKKYIENYDSKRDKQYLEFIIDPDEKINELNKIQEKIINKQNITEEDKRLYEFTQNKKKFVKLNCDNIILCALYCQNININKKDEFILDLLDLEKNIDPKLLIYAVEEQNSPKIVNKMIEKLNKRVIEKLFNEKGETLDLIAPLNHQYNFNGISFARSLLFIIANDYSIPLKERKKAIQNLLNNGADINLTDKDGNTILKFLIVKNRLHGGESELIKFIKERGGKI